MPIRTQIIEIKSTPVDDDRLLCDLKIDDVAGRVVEMTLGRDHFEVGTQYFARLDPNAVRRLIDHLEAWIRPIEREAARRVFDGDHGGASQVLQGKATSR